MKRASEEDELLLEEISLLLLIDEDEDTSSLLEEGRDDSEVISEFDGVTVLLELALEGATLHAPKTKPINIGNKRNAFFISFISPY